MRKTTMCLIAVLMCAWVSSFGLSNGVPQWKVVKQGHIASSNNDNLEQTIFTPSKNGLYRLTIYMSTVGPTQDACYYFVVFLDGFVWSYGQR
jgi:hypothetical protein